MIASLSFNDQISYVRYKFLLKNHTLTNQKSLIQITKFDIQDRFEVWISSFISNS